MTDIEILEMTYTDLLTIKRKEKVKNPITGVTEYVEVVIVEGVKCALSKNRSTDIMQVDGIGALSETYQLFANPSIDVKTGDTLIIKSLSGEDVFKVANKPFAYSSHLELYLSYKDRV